MKRIIAIINYLAAQNSPRGVTTIGKDLGFHKSSVYQILSYLKKEQWVVQDLETKKYSLGLGLLQVGLSILSQNELRSASLPIMQDLGRQTHEAILLSIRVGLQRMYIDHRQSDRDLRHVAEIGKLLPLYAGAPGKAILAHLKEEDIAVVISDLRESSPYTLANGQVINVEKLQEELDKIKGQGFAVTAGERLLGSAAVAAPIFRSNQVIGAISISGPTATLNVELANHYGPLVTYASKNISIQLG